MNTDCAVCGKPRIYIRSNNKLISTKRLSETRFCSDCWNTRRSECRPRSIKICKQCLEPMPGGLPKNRKLCVNCCAALKERIAAQQNANARRRLLAQTAKAERITMVDGVALHDQDIAYITGKALATVKAARQRLSREGRGRENLLVKRGRGRGGRVKDGRLHGLLEHDGERRSVAAWARVLGVSNAALYKRLRYQSIEEAVLQLRLKAESKRDPHPSANGTST